MLVPSNSNPYGLPKRSHIVIYWSDCYLPPGKVVQATTHRTLHPEDTQNIYSCTEHIVLQS
jgi:hypothetical protein